MTRWIAALLALLAGTGEVRAQVPFTFDVGVGLIDKGQVNANFANLNSRVLSIYGVPGTWTAAQTHNAPIILGNTFALNFTETSGHTNGGFVLDASNVLNLNGTGPGGSPAGIFNVALANTSSVVNWVRPLNISPAAQAFSTTVTPTLAVHNGPTGTISSGSAFFNTVTADTDAFNASGASGGGASLLYVGHTINAGAVGGRTSLFVNLNQVGAGTAANGQFYVAGGFFANAAASAGGATGVGNDRGNLFGTNPSALLKTGAGAFWTSVVGEEVDVGLQTGTAAAYKTGFKVVQWASDAVSGTTADYAYGISNQSGGTAPGWTVGFAFNGPEGWWPIKAAGTMLGTYASTTGGGPAMAAAYGMDFSAVTFSTAFLKSTGFLVDGSGNVTGPSYNVAGATSGLVTLKPQAIAGTYELDLPITAGSAGQALTSQGGAGTAMTWTTPTIAPFQQVVTASSGTITQTAGATTLDLETWSPGGAGGNGATCAAATACSGGAGGGSGGHGRYLNIPWPIGGATSCSVVVGQPVSPGGAGVITSVTCGTIVYSAGVGGNGQNGATGANAGGGGGGGIFGGGNGSGGTGGTAGNAGAGAGLSACSGFATARASSDQGSGGAAGVNGAVGCAAGDSQAGASGAGSGGGCVTATGAATAGSLGGTAAIGAASVGGAGKSSTGSPGSGGGGSASSTTTASTGGVGGLPAGGGGGGGSGCNGTGVAGAGGVSGGGMVIATQH